MEPSARQIAHVRHQQNGQPREASPIAASFSECVQLMDQLVSLADSQKFPWTGASVSLDIHASKLRAWGNDTGAASRSLDHALRKASRLKQQVLLLLSSLKSDLQTGMA
jgi:hypothetical protein